MDFEVLKRSHLKRNIIIGVVVVAIISAVILNFTRAKYRVTESIPLVNGTINYTPFDFKMVAMYQENDNGEYESVDTMPSSGYVINEEQSYCTTDNVNKDTNVKLYTNTDGEHVIANLQKNSKCYLYFDEYNVSAKDYILSNYPTVLTRNDFSTIVTAITTGIIYKSADNSQYDDDGEVYYFAGAPSDNWLKWGGFYWRIIRINGDGTIRIIYNGTSTATVGTSTQTGTSAFNSSYDDNMYVGFKYTSGSVHGLETNSIILGTLNTWYQNNLAGYAGDIDTNAGFCNDRYPSTSSSISNGSGGTGTTLTYYAAYIRINVNKSPSFRCQTNTDLFTASGSNKGNKSLLYPIGLISADEAAYAGGVDGTNNTNYYLYTGQNYWTISPSSATNAFVFIVASNGRLFNEFTTEELGVRPVINLRADVTISSGDGTRSNPYEIAT